MIHAFLGSNHENNQEYKADKPYQHHTDVCIFGKDCRKDVEKIRADRNYKLFDPVSKHTKRVTALRTDVPLVPAYGPE